MLALIKREIDDHMVFFVVAAIAAFVFVFTLVRLEIPVINSKLPVGIPITAYSILFWFLPALSVASAALGAAQMYSDKNKKISTFLSTLATTRRQILTAKIITGVLWILFALLPLAIAQTILLHIFPRLVPIDITFLVKAFVLTFLASLACYALGLQMGWNSNKLFPTLGSIALAPLLLGVIVIKGVCIETAVLLLLFAASMILRTWKRFISTSL